ncbi:MAG TPA: dTMP kinase [Candidatus Limnocylindrales bacterium]|nr:dTMP kinase [Candidatus Limnocylindrales bacterium]
MPTRGWFITIEGPEGSGKTTHAGRLLAYLEANGVRAIGTREPGGTALGEHIRDLLLESADRDHDPLADALLFSAARRQLVQEVIRPALLAGTTVVCARFADSTLAYQGYGSGLPLDDLRALERVATGGLKPDLTVLLDVPPEVGLRRKGPDDRTRFELAFDLDFHARVRDGFLALAAAEPRRFAVIDASTATGAVWEAVRAAADRLIASSEASGEPERAGERIQR